MATQKNAFKRAREAKGYTQEQVAHLTGVTQSTLTDLETSSNTNPTWSVLGRLCRCYGRRPEDLLGWPQYPGENNRKHEHRHRQTPLVAEVVL